MAIFETGGLRRSAEEYAKQRGGGNDENKGQNGNTDNVAADNEDDEEKNITDDEDKDTPDGFNSRRNARALRRIHSI